MSKGKLARFLVVGIGSALFYFSLSWLLQARFNFSPFFASGFGYFCAFCAAYLLQHKWTFRSDALHAVTLPRYATAQALTALLTASCTQAASYFYPGASARVLAAGSTLLAGGCSFVLSSTWVFSRTAKTLKHANENDLG